MGSETIIVVEDEEATRTVVERVLEKQGYTVRAAASGEEAEALSSQHGAVVDLLLTDVVMPRCSWRGLFACLSAIRADLKVL